MTNIPHDTVRCTNESCPLKESCKRYIVLNPIIPFNQYMWITTFEPKTIDKVITCDGFIKVEIKTENE